VIGWFFVSALTRRLPRLQSWPQPRARPSIWVNSGQASITRRMCRTCELRPFPALLGAVCLFGPVLVAPIGVLYWLMRPTILANSGLSAYQAPTSLDLVHRMAGDTVDVHALSIAAARRETEVVYADARPAFAAAQDAQASAKGRANGRSKFGKSVRVERACEPDNIHRYVPIRQRLRRGRGKFPRSSQPGIADLARYRACPRRSALGTPSATLFSSR
jgi:hypothetical protein